MSKKDRCARYKSEGRRERNKARRVARRKRRLGDHHRTDRWRRHFAKLHPRKVA